MTEAGSTPTLTSDYIEAHMLDIHTDESWAKAIAEDVLRAASYQVGDGSADQVVVDAQFTVTPVRVSAQKGTFVSGDDPEARLCIKVCVTVSSGSERCHHFYVAI